MIMLVRKDFYIFKFLLAKVSVPRVFKHNLSKNKKGQEVYKFSVPKYENKETRI